MTTLHNATNQKLVETYNALCNVNIDFNTFLLTNNQDQNLARQNLISNIQNKLQQVGFNGPNNTEAIYLFGKGLNLPAPRPTQRYIDSDQGFFNNLKNKVQQKHRTRDDIRIRRPINFQTFMKTAEQRRQEEYVNYIKENLDRTATDWEINFEPLNDYGKHLLCGYLQNFLQKKILPLPFNGQYKISFSVNGEWHSVPLNAQTFDVLYSTLSEETFIFDIDNRPPEYFYEKGSMQLPSWSLFSSLKFSTVYNQKANRDVGGTFFTYLVKEECPQMIKDYLTKLQIFDKLVDENGKQREELNDCCFVYALQQTGLYDEDTLNKIRLRIQNRYLSQSSVNHLCEEFKIKIKLTFINEDAQSKNKKQTVRSISNKKAKSFMGVKEPLPNRSHHFNIYEKHYFIEEKTPFSTYYIQHLEELDESKFNKEMQNKRWKTARFFISASNLVRELLKKNYFIPITYGQASVLKTIFYNEINPDLENVSLDYNPDFCLKPIQPRKFKEAKEKYDKTYWYCDFETDISGEVHTPFMCCLQNMDATINKCFMGPDCGLQLLNFLPTNAVIYFHNLAYDIRMVASYGITKSIIKGTRTMMTDITYNKKILHFKDSLPILSCKLSQLPKMFNIQNIQKEIFPYKYYTLDKLLRKDGTVNKYARGVIEEAGKNEDKAWTKQDYILFTQNINKIPNCRIDDKHFNMWNYAKFYCEQDVNILRIGFNAFRNGFIKDFTIDPFKFISISSLANEVFNKRVYFGHDLFKVGGIIRKFCSHAVYGGRCMTAYNKKWHTTTDLVDFDAVSLYPSAMSRGFTVQGAPTVIEKENLNLDFLSKQGYYIVEIKITKCHKHYPFPLIVQKVNGLNLNDDHITNPIKMIVDCITLEDLIEFQKIDYEIIRGYYWSGKRDYTIQEEIRKIFNKRKEYKKLKNPLENLYKLIMNSCYGKTIERPIEKDYKYIKSGEELDKFWMKNYNKIIEDIELSNSNIHAIKIQKPIDKHFNFSMLGILVLSMSKRIMNEVMCLAFDLGCHIYYQDTDSMHIESQDLPKLEKAFKEKYGRDLIGTDLGQFHSDFPTINNHEEMPHSIESYFLMKKMYIDKLQDSTGEIDYMIRGKGLTLNSIEHAYKNKFNQDPIELYDYLFNGNTQEFDLTQGQACFSMNKNMTVSTLKKFKRKIKTDYEEGKREKYFEYAK